MKKVIVLLSMVLAIACNANVKGAKKVSDEGKDKINVVFNATNIVFASLSILKTARTLIPHVTHEDCYTCISPSSTTLQLNCVDFAAKNWVVRIANWQMVSFVKFVIIERQYESQFVRKQITIRMSQKDVISAENYAIEAKTWQARGVSVIGGCCGIGCEHIGMLSKSLYE